ncbi:Arc family DNA-binding protein [Gluconobacter oxydans]|uniref:Arc family DNA-binding protein n=1 Tax=Gluconobacter oxydans TaxID=442 RepID=UPI00062C40AA|nr:Arc family DNA-binding protein [Gluconobacter oxydans]
MATDDVQFRIRLNPHLKSRLENIAEEEGRSLNAEIARRLESSLDSFRYTKRDEWIDRLSGLNEWLLEIDEQMRRFSLMLPEVSSRPDMEKLLRPIIIAKMASLQKERDRLCDEEIHIRSKIRAYDNH